MIRTVSRLAALLVACDLSAVASAACSDFSQQSCRLAALTEADRDLNAVYSKLLSHAAEKRSELQATQRTWLKGRDESCALGALSSRSDWMQQVSLDASMFNCVYASTRARLDELRGQPMLVPRESIDVIDRYETTFPASRNSGKWYMEVGFLARNYETQPGQYVQLAATDGGVLMGMQTDYSQMRSGVGENGLYVLALAIDLDHGRVYWAENGKWNGGKPDSADGVAIQLGKPFSFRLVSSGRSLSRDLARGLALVNPGTAPFRYPTPAGYQPFYTPPPNVDGGSRLDWIVPSYERVAGKSYLEWSAQYWAWLLPQTERNPVLDLTGELCGNGQSGPVWFLAGGDAKSRITRRCKVPSGKYLFLPAAVQMLSSKVGFGPCEKLEADALASRAANAILSDFVSIDGQRFDALYDYRLHVPKCTTIRGPHGEAIASDLVYYGTWVMLHPLPEGRHTISFGGSLPARDSDRSVTYVLDVE